VAIQLPNGRNYFEATGGGPAVGYKLFAYVPGTSTPKDTYTTSVGDVANAHPVVMNARGEAAIYWDGTYDVSLYTAADVLVWGPERLTDAGDGIRADLASTASSSVGTGLLGWLRNLTGAVATTLYNWLHWRDPSVFEFMTAAQIADVQAGTLAVDVTTAIQTAWTTGKDIRHPRGSYRISADLVPVGTQKLYGASRHGVHFVQHTAGERGITIDGVANTFIRDIRLSCNAVSTAAGIYITNANPTYIEDVHITAFSNGVEVRQSNNTFLTRLYCVDNLVDGVDIEQGIDTYINTLYSSGNDGVGLALSGACSGTYIVGAQVAANGTNFKTRFLQPGNTTGIPSQTFITGLVSDSATEHGIYMEQANETKFAGSWSSNVGTGKNWFIGPQVTDTQINGCKTFNCVGHGVEVQGIRTSINGGSFQDAGAGFATFSNIFITGASATGTLITGARCYSPANTAKYGIRVTGSALNTTVTGCDLTGNVTAGYLDDSGVGSNVELNNRGGVGNFTFAGTVSTAALNVDSNGFVRSETATLANGATMDIALPSNGRGIMLATSSCVSVANSAIRTQANTSIFVYDAESSFTTITTANGSGGGATYTLTLVTSNTIRFTNTSGASANCHLTLFGMAQN